MAPSGTRGTYAAALISVITFQSSGSHREAGAGIVVRYAHALDRQRRIAALRPEA